MDTEDIINWIVLAVVIVCFIADRILGWRVVGIAVAGFGARIIWTRRIPYGIEGRPPSGYLTGWMAVTAGIATLLIGAVFLAIPESIDNMFGRGK
jgi:hypothetical protein